MTKPTDYGKKFRRGEGVSVSALNQIAEMASRTNEVSITGGSAGYYGVNGIGVTVEPEAEFWILIGEANTSYGRKHHYEFISVQRKKSTHPGTDVPWDNDYEWDYDTQGPAGDTTNVEGDPGPVGTTDYRVNMPAVEINGNENVPAGTITRAWYGPGPDNSICLLFDYSNGGGTDVVNNYIDATITYGGSTTITVGGSTATNYTDDATVSYGSSTSVTHNGRLTIQGPFYQPPQTYSIFTGNVIDLSLTTGNVRIRVSCDTDFTQIQSIVPGATPAGRILILHNVGEKVFLIPNNSGNNANSILTTTGNYYWFAPNHDVVLVYDAVDSRWRVSENSYERLEGVDSDEIEFSENLDDFAPDLNYAQHILTPTEVGLELTGIANGVPGLRHRFINGSDVLPFTLTHSDGASLTPNRWVLPDGEDLDVPPGASFEADYGSDLAWRPLGICCNEKQFIFTTIAVAGQDDVVADDPETTLTFASGGGVDISTNATTKTITFTFTVDASVVTYTPAQLDDWLGGVDPGNVDDALDQLSAVVHALVNSVLDLDDLGDVTITSPSTGDSLVFNGTVWVNETLAYALNDLDSVNVPSPTDGQVLTWDSATSNWIAADPVGGTIEFSDLPESTAGVLGRSAASSGALGMIAPSNDREILFRQDDDSLAWGFPDKRSITFVGARRNRSASTLTSGDGVWTYVNFLTEEYDTNTIWIGGGNLAMFVPTGMGGKWRFATRILLASGEFLSNVPAYVRLIKNDSAIYDFDSVHCPAAPGGRPPYFSLYAESNIAMSAGEYVGVQMMIPNGGIPIYFVNTSYTVWFECEYLGR